jgi:[CysO sulfur-carrier protein]-S-L-cysteine hydrolase
MNGPDDHPPGPGPFRLVVPQAIYAALLGHLRAALPAEGCGLLAGTVVGGVGRVTLHLPLVNALNSPTEYESDPPSMFAAHRAMRAAGVDVLAVYHSHPTSEPVPSRRDRERNYSDGVVNVIVGMANDEVRAWWLTASDAREADWVVEG